MLLSHRNNIYEEVDMLTFRYIGPALLEVGLVAELLSVSPNTVYAWARAGQIESVKLPSGGIRIPAKAVADILGITISELMEALNRGNWSPGG
jgi:excisionase family DNA binding protein